jgi:hypothetical protein
MPHDDRNRGFRNSRFERGGRMPGGTDRDRYATGNEQRYRPSWDEDTDRNAFESDRSYAAGGYSEEFGNRAGGSRDWARGQGQRGGDYGTRDGRNRATSDPWDPGHSEHDQARHARGRDDSHWPERLSELRRTRGGGLGWDERDDNNESYFGTGTYYGAYGTQPGASASGRAYSRMWEQRSDDDTRAPSSGDYEMFGRSPYGSQSGYARNYGRSRDERGGARERFAEERYGREPEYGYGFGEGAYKREVGEFRGRGPRGYERSDDRLREIICERLTDEPSIDASDVSIEVKDKVVKLTGQVADRRTKYEIEDLVEHCGGVKDIDNQIRVRSGPLSPSM